MSYPNRDNPYAFDAFLQWRENCDYCADDPFAQKVIRTFCGDRVDEVDRAVRELVMLQKIATSWDCPEVVRSAMSLFGGHGVMEDFSSLPRLYRDAAVNELWEGPRNVLLAQIHRDLQKSSTWYEPAEFVNNVLAGADARLVKKFEQEITEIFAHPNLFEMTPETIAICEQWDSFCQRLFHAYQDVAMTMVMAS